MFDSKILRSQHNNLLKEAANRHIIAHATKNLKNGRQ